MPKDEPIVLENLKLVLRFVDKDYSRYTLSVPLFKFSKSFLGVEEKFSRHLKLNYLPRKYPLMKMANLVNSLIACGVERFVRLEDEFAVERGLAKSLGFPDGFPSSDTVYRFLQSFTGWNINQLERVNLEVLREQKDLWLPRSGAVFIDLDMNTKSVEGKKIEQAALGYNRKRPGRLSLQWTVGFVAKVALFSQLHSGKASGKTILRDQLSYLKKSFNRLELDFNERRYILRVDSGYFSWENLKLLNQYRFLTRVPKNLKVFKPHLDRGLTWKRYSKATEYVDLGELHFPDPGLDLRVVLVRTHQKQKTKLYPLVTNLNWTARQIVKGYRGRQIVENCFRDTNQAFYSDKLPSSSFHGNQAYLWFVLLAYNQFFFFQKPDRSKKFSSDDPENNHPKVSQKSRRVQIPRKELGNADISRSEA